MGYKGKRILFFVLAVLVVLSSMTACTKKTVQEDKTKESPEADYQIGVEPDNAPYYYTNEEGTPEGLYVDIMEALAEKEEFTFDFIEISAADFYTLAENGCDAFLGAMETETGDMTVLLQTEPFYQSRLYLFAKEDGRISAVRDLRDCTIAARASTGEEVFAAYLAAKYGASSLGFRSQTDVLTDVEQGYSEAFVMDEQNYKQQKKDNVSYNVIKKSGKYYNSHRFTVGNHPEFLAILENGMQILEDDGILTDLLQTYGL